MSSRFCSWEVVKRILGIGLRVKSNGLIYCKGVEVEGFVFRGKVATQGFCHRASVSVLPSHTLNPP